MECTADADGSNIRNGREYLFLNDNEDVSHFEVPNSGGKTGNGIFPCVQWRSPATKSKSPIVGILYFVSATETFLPS